MKKYLIMTMFTVSREENQTAMLGSAQQDRSLLEHQSTGAWFMMPLIYCYYESNLKSPIDSNIL